MCMHNMFSWRNKKNIKSFWQNKSALTRAMDTIKPYTSPNSDYESDTDSDLDEDIVYTKLSGDHEV